MLSILSGFAIPFLYTVIVAPSTPYIKDHPTLGLLAMVPVRWPVLLLFRLRMVPFESDTAILMYLIASNLVVYALLTYVLLWGFSKRKSRLVATPPHPPTFIQQ